MSSYRSALAYCRTVQEDFGTGPGVPFRDRPALTDGLQRGLKKFIMPSFVKQ